MLLRNCFSINYKKKMMTYKLSVINQNDYPFRCFTTIFTLAYGGFSYCICLLFLPGGHNEKDLFYIMYLVSTSLVYVLPFHAIPATVFFIVAFFCLSFHYVVLWLILCKSGFSFFLWLYFFCFILVNKYLLTNLDEIAAKCTEWCYQI